jgi:hypothetical protein
MITLKDLCLKTITGTTSGTPGTRTTHAHGLGYAPTKTHILVDILPGDDDNNAANGTVGVVKTDATYIYVKGSVASTAFIARVILNKDAGERTFTD